MVRYMYVTVVVIRFVMNSQRLQCTSSHTNVHTENKTKTEQLQLDEWLNR